MWPTTSEYAQACAELDFYEIARDLGFVCEDCRECAGDGCESCDYRGQVEFAATEWFAREGIDEEYERQLWQVYADYRVAERTGFPEEPSESSCS